MSCSLDADQAQHFTGPSGSNLLQKSALDNTGSEKINGVLSNFSQDSGTTLSMLVKKERKCAFLNLCQLQDVKSLEPMISCILTKICCKCSKEPLVVATALSFVGYSLGTAALRGFL